MPPAVRAQLLATEHWSLLATRSMIWSEVMSRISILLTVTSACLVVVGLTVQSAGFGDAFHVLATGLSAVVLLLGTLTAVRVHNVMDDDEALVLAMNRLRAAYVDLDAGIAPYLLTGATDDDAGVAQTYGLWRTRRTSQLLGSTGIFVIAVNAVVAGVFVALVTQWGGAPTAVTAVLGGLGLLGYAAGFFGLSARDHRRTTRAWSPRFPTGRPLGPPSQGDVSRP